MRASAPSCAGYGFQSGFGNPRPHSAAPALVGARSSDRTRYAGWEHPVFRVCRSRHARARETSARGGEQSLISHVGSAGETTASRATASCSSTSTWTRTSSWSRGTSGRTCRRCCERSSRTRCVHGSIRWVGRDARSTNPKKMRGEKDRRFFFFGSGIVPSRGARLVSRKRRPRERPPCTDKTRTRRVSFSRTCLVSSLTHRWRVLVPVGTGSS